MTERMATRGVRAGHVFLGCTRFPACRGSLPVGGSNQDQSPKSRKPTSKKKAPSSPKESAGQRQPLNVGDLLISSANDLGVGKAVSRNGALLVLEYFDNPGQPAEQRFRAEVPLTGLRRFRLDQEVRAFWLKDSTWQSGRLDEINEYRDISVRTKGKTIFLKEKDVYVRWDRPLDDPVGFGEAGLMESPYLSDLRRPFMQHILEQRSAAHGMGAALCSSIQLHPHQLDAARRVLEDPIQRYLLADEVGLGKTIEAGIVIRQILQDSCDATVCLILPPFLVEQWRHELDTKFNVTDFGRGRITFARDDQPQDWVAADLLVIDEAHNIARLRVSRNSLLQKRYERLAEIALASSRLLLLSATPVLHNEEIYLGMLRLLDPALYGKTTAEELREKVAVRTELGKSLLGLKPSLPKSVISRRLADLRRLLINDHNVEALVRDAEEALLDSDKEILTAAINELQTYISDIYRVHRRMIRTRRTEGLKSGYAVQGRAVPTAWQLESGPLQTSSILLEEWRQFALASVEVGNLDIDIAAELLSQATAVLLDPSATTSWANERLKTALSEDESSVLRRIKENALDVDRSADISRPIADWISYEVAAHERAVIFCPTADLAEDVRSAIADLIGEDSVGAHLETSDPSIVQELIHTFESNSSRKRILVCDSSAEEGRNFQLADVIVHVGVPSDANQLEQRIGRCDRWTGKVDSIPARSFIVTAGSNPDGWDAAWFKVISGGFEVFSNSIASLQHAVDLAVRMAWKTLLESGTSAVDELQPLVQDLLAKELGSVREQDALDSREALSDTRSIFAHIQTSESLEADFAAATDGLLARDGASGNLRLKRIGNPVTGEGSYSITPDHRAEPPLIPLWRVRRDFVRLEGQLATFKRELAVTRPPVRLYRYGAPFINAVSDFIWHDDRGRCFGMWRFDPDWQFEELAAYRFDYHVEAAIPPIASSGIDPDQHLAIQRRADALFPPAVETIWVADDGSVITDQKLLNRLNRKYRKPTTAEPAGDFNLNTKRLEKAYQIISQDRWRPAWRSAETTARTALSSLESLAARVTAGLERCKLDAIDRDRQLALRQSHSEGAEKHALQTERQLENTMATQLQTAVAHPQLGLDATGIVILSGQPFDGDAT